jgi:2-keto-3-deoxy-L-rhamnonate aldolase RhmA
LERQLDPDRADRIGRRRRQYRRHRRHAGDPDVQAAAGRVIEACAKAGIGCGTHIVDTTAANMEAAFAAGYTFMALSSDVFLLGQWAGEMRDIIPTVRRTG